MFSHFRKIKSKDLPKIIHTQQLGDLILHLNYLVERNGDLHHLAKDALLPSDIQKAEFIHYSLVKEDKSGIHFGFHPPSRGKVKCADWSKMIDAAYAKYQQIGAL